MNSIVKKICILCDYYTTCGYSLTTIGAEVCIFHGNINVLIHLGLIKSYNHITIDTIKEDINSIRDRVNKK